MLYYRNLFCTDFFSCFFIRIKKIETNHSRRKMFLLYLSQCRFLRDFLASRRNERTCSARRRDFPFFQISRSRHLKPVDLSLRDSDCLRDVDVATSHEQTTTIEGLPSSCVMERENEGEGEEKGRASYTISYSARLHLSSRLPKGSISQPPLFLSRGLPFSRPRSRRASHLENSYREGELSNPQFSHLFTSVAETAFG